MHARQLIGGAIAGAAALVALAAPASAHVTVDPPTAPQGGSAELAFRIPTESETASTVKVDLQLPVDHPLASVSVKPHDGWTHQVVTRKLDAPIDNEGTQVTEVVSEITWTATGGGIAPGEFDDLAISVGPLPTDTDTLVFKVVQTYSDGSETAWIELPDASGKEPEHPAPTLALTPGEAPASNSSSGSTASSAPSTSSTGSSSTSSASGDAAGASKEGSGDDSNGLATAALVLGAVGVALGAIALSRTRRSRPPS